jgi:lambda family phage portal protein
MASLLGPDGSPVKLPALRGASRMLAAGYAGASVTDPDLAQWRPPLWSAQTALSPDRPVLAARIHDLARNDGWASGGVTRQVDAVIGAGWRLSSKPNARSLRIDPDVASDLASDIEAAWKDFADDPDCWCDAGRRLSMGGLLSLAFRHRLMDGEALAVILWLPRGGRYATAVQIIDPDRLSNPYNSIDTYWRRQGIELGEHGEPRAYHIRRSHPGDQNVFNPMFWTWERIPRETSFGRRMVVHAFEPSRAGQYRGVSVLAPIIKRLRMLGRYDEAELQAAVLNAVMAAFVESPFDHDQFASALGGGEELSAYQQQRLDYYQAAPINVGGAKIAFTFPGEKVTLSKPSHPNSVFEAFERASLRNIASAMGMTYEQLSMDWGQVNYSSARAALLEVWRGFAARKEHFAQAFMAPIYAAWLEEAIDRGIITLPKGAPDFAEAKAAYCSAKWIGPGRGWVDPHKEATAATERLAAGLSTLERECAEQGEDYLETIQQRARERKEMMALGLDPDAMPDRRSAPSDDGDTEQQTKRAKAFA